MLSSSEFNEHRPTWNSWRNGWCWQCTSGMCSWPSTFSLAYTTVLVNSARTSSLNSQMSQQGWHSSEVCFDSSSDWRGDPAVCPDKCRKSLRSHSAAWSPFSWREARKTSSVLHCITRPCFGAHHSIHNQNWHSGHKRTNVSSSRNGYDKSKKIYILVSYWKLM